jgi:hypothetical protein
MHGARIGCKTILCTAVLLLFIGFVAAESALKLSRKDMGSNGGLAEIRAVPNRVNFQGFLTDSLDNPLTDTMSIEFRIYDLVSGGTLLWSETQTSVEVTEGVFNVQLGSVTPVPDYVFPGDSRWLELEIASEILAPRTEISSVAYSYRSDRADTADFSLTSMVAQDLVLPYSGIIAWPVEAFMVINSGPGSALRGEHLMTGNFGYLGSLNYGTYGGAFNGHGVYGQHLGSGNYGFLADGIYGAYGQNVPFDNQGHLGGDTYGAYGEHGFTQNYGFLGSEEYGAVGRNVGSGNFGYLGGSFGAYGENSMTGNYGYLGSDSCGVLGHGLGFYGVYGKSDVFSVIGENENGNYGFLGGDTLGAAGQHWANMNYGYLGSPSYGVFGRHDMSGNHGYIGSQDYGVFGQSGSGTGVYGKNTEYEGYGVYGKHQHSGNYGYLGNRWYGVYGYSYGFAGFFEGEVQVTEDLHVTGDIYKANCYFLIDHPLDPENELLLHSCVESPENLLIYRGTVELDQGGSAIVRMPDYFEALADGEGASVTLTSVGRPFPAGYEWLSDRAGFQVYGEPNREVSWVVYAERDDPVIRERRKPVEVTKGPGQVCEPGELLYPSAYGYPTSRRAVPK